MKRRRLLGSGGIATLVLLLAAGLVLAEAPSAGPLGTAFTYQGRLQSGEAPYTGICDLQFTLWDAELGGAQVGTTQTVTGVAVNDGYLTAELDFGGGSFAGDARWLEISVRCPAGAGEYTLLTPRQSLTAAPYALWAAGAPWSGLSGVPAGLADGADDNTTYSAGTGLELSGGAFRIAAAYRLPQSCAAGQIAKWNGSAWACAADDSGGDGAAGWALTGNAGTTPGSHFLGTTDDRALELRVKRQRALLLEPNVEGPNLIGGFGGNVVTAGAYGATISGGGLLGQPNRVTDTAGTVGGGFSNRAGDAAGTVSDRPGATVGGGGSNAAGGHYATVGGGSNNKATGDDATIGGGELNTAGSEGATVGGGGQNTAGGASSTVGGGATNQAIGAYATVGGGGRNTAGGASSTIGGGATNQAGREYATVGGGSQNSAADAYATVGGGAKNEVGGEAGTVCGGEANYAGGEFSTVAGGLKNTAQGNYSFAAGHRAKANHEGSFVWADSTDSDWSSSAAKQFLVRASGGVGINTNAPSAQTLTVGGVGLRVAVDGTTFQRIQAGTALLGQGGAGSGVRRFKVTFPVPFASTPAVIATARGSDYNDVFVVTTRSITTDGFEVNVYRVDIAGGGWTQSLQLDWLAWEVGP